MAGHNKWSKIKNKKAVSDAYKAKVFTKLLKFISVESKKAKGDTSSPGLKRAIEKAKKENVPSENIDRAIKKGSGENVGDLERIIYEAYGPGGCAIIIDTLTDNRNRTVQEIKHILSKNGFELGAIGSAVWAFQKTLDESYIPKNFVPIGEEDATLLSSIIEELEDNDDVQETYTNAE